VVAGRTQAGLLNLSPWQPRDSLVSTAGRCCFLRCSFPSILPSSFSSASPSFFFSPSSLSPPPAARRCFSHTCSVFISYGVAFLLVSVSLRNSLSVALLLTSVSIFACCIVITQAQVYVARYLDTKSSLLHFQSCLKIRLWPSPGVYSLLPPRSITPPSFLNPNGKKMEKWNEKRKKKKRKKKPTHALPKLSIQHSSLLPYTYNRLLSSSLLPLVTSENSSVFLLCLFQPPPPPPSE
jgi:hypothetical protein